VLFRSGPLSKVYAETTYENCDKYDKHFTTTQDMVREFNAWYEAGIYDNQNGTSTQSDQYPGYKVPEIIKNWHENGDVSQGQDYFLAPFYDFNGDGHYNWQDGDYPWHDIKKTKECSVDRKVSLYGDINFWWVMNDKGNIHTETGADPIGMEIRGQAFAFASNDEINNMTFYNYELINRGTQPFYNTYFGFFVVGDLGDTYEPDVMLVEDLLTITTAIILMATILDTKVMVTNLQRLELTFLKVHIKTMMESILLLELVHMKR